MKLVVWQNSMSSHQLYLWEALRTLTGEEFVVVLEMVKDHMTKKISADEVNGLGTIIYPSGFWPTACVSILSRYRDFVHIFLGFRNVWYFFPLILYAIANDFKVAVMNEPYSTRPIGYNQEEASWLLKLKVSTRPLLYRAMAKLLNGAVRRVQPCILPLSQLAYDQFAQNGFNPNAMYPFGYFVPRQLVDESKPVRMVNKLNIIFVGLLLERKGLDVAAKAVEALCQQGYDISLDVYGIGSPEKFISPTSSCVHYKGALLPQDVQSEIRRHDLLILPSRHDGWGVVVNEALLQGVPVIASDQVGAKCLIEKSGSGVIFKSENIGDLTLKLEQLISNPALFEEMRRNADAAGNAISPSNGAKYLLDVFRHHFCHTGYRPTALWTND